MSKNKRVWSDGNANGATVGGTMRVRAKALDQVDDDKLTLAFWLLAKKLVEDKTDTRAFTREEVVREARRLDGDASALPESQRDNESDKDAA